MHHYMTPTTVAALLLLALVIDHWSVGPDSIRDRIAFFIALPTIYEGFNGSPLDNWTVGLLEGGIQKLLSMTGGAYIAGASANVVLGIGIGIYALYVTGILLPKKLSKHAGRWVDLSWKTTGLHRLNPQLWIAAIVIGMLCDLPQGAVGSALMFVIELLADLVSPIPNWLFGAV